MACSTKRDEQTQSCRVSFELTKPDEANLVYVRINGLDINLLSQEFEAEFVINSGARAPERVTRAANSQSQGTWRASVKNQFTSHESRRNSLFCSRLRGHY